MIWEKIVYLFYLLKYYENIIIFKQLCPNPTTRTAPVRSGELTPLHTQCFSDWRLLKGCTSLLVTPKSITEGLGLIGRVLRFGSTTRMDIPSTIWRVKINLHYNAQVCTQTFSAHLQMQFSKSKNLVARMQPSYWLFNLAISFGGYCISSHNNREITKELSKLALCPWTP